MGKWRANFKGMLCGDNCCVKEKDGHHLEKSIVWILFVLVILKHAKILSSHFDSQKNISIPTTIQQTIVENGIVISDSIHTGLHQTYHLLLAHLNSENLEQYFHFEEQQQSITKVILNIEFVNNRSILVADSAMDIQIATVAETILQ
ncbi:hypothetical protein CDAR_558311 [Caerostris darwini]|uniref:Uncharacterized protein n=1 Tax=Caerostris darwini TaxID=1538125 RepID=A0AAV4R4E3_9ARAC|nr:hypothetical protein CDAR_558311 [Caerostris darwini]